MLLSFCAISHFLLLFFQQNSNFAVKTSYSAAFSRPCSPCIWGVQEMFSAVRTPLSARSPFRESGGLGHDTGTDDDQQTGDCRGEKCSADATRKISNSNLLKLQCWADNGRNCNMYESAGQYGENKNPKGKINFKTGIGGERN